jgi:hypothetical protein
MPLLAVETIEPELLDAMPGFKERLEWYLENRPDLASLISRWQEPGAGDRRLISLTRGHRMKCLLRRLLDPNEFLSDYGVRSLSKFHEANPYVLDCEDGAKRVVHYDPGESQTNMFGGNSNWRGPVWFPVNVLLADKLRTYGRHFGDSFTIEIPTGSGNLKTLVQAADLIDGGLTALFRPVNGRRPADGDRIEASDNPLWSKHPTFSEFFDGDTGEGLGATHQTGWTALVAHLLNPRLPPDPRHKGWA